MKILATLLILLSLFVNTAFAREYAVVSSQTLGDIPIEKIKALFLKKTFFIGDKKVVPVNLSPRDAVRSSFEKNVLLMSFNRLNTYWTKQHYLGHRPPVTMKSQESVKKFIKRVENAIGYIELSQVDKDLIILYKWSD